MRRLTMFAVAGVMAFAVSAASAGEIVYFTNGTFLKIDSHEVKGEMVQVNLDANSRLAFPGRMIERIEGATGVVWGKGSTAVANQAAPGVNLPPTANASPGVRGYDIGSKKQWNQDAGNGLRGMKPAQTGFAMSGDAGNQSYLDGVVLQTQQDGPPGTITRGNRLIVNPDTVTSKGRAPVRFGAKNMGPGSNSPTPVSPQPPAVNVPVPDVPAEYVPVSDDPPSEPEPADETPEPDPGNENPDGGN